MALVDVLRLTWFASAPASRRRPPGAIALRQGSAVIRTAPWTPPHPLLPRRKPSDKRNPLLRHAPVAQLDRAPPSEGGGHTFESCRVRHFRTEL